MCEFFDPDQCAAQYIHSTSETEREGAPHHYWQKVAGEEIVGNYYCCYAKAHTKAMYVASMYLDVVGALACQLELRVVCLTILNMRQEHDAAV